MFADHLSLRAMTERRLADVRDAQTRAYRALGAGHARPLATVFGQVEALTARAALDVEAFYDTRVREAEPGVESDLLVLSADGKGIVMRPDALRPATAKAAAAGANKLTCRLSKGERRNRKRLAEVGVVYDLTPVALSGRAYPSLLRIAG